jgi:hypothetical protein
MTQLQIARLAAVLVLLLTAVPRVSFAQTVDEKPESVRPETDKPSNSAPGARVEPTAPAEDPLDIPPPKRTPKSVIIDQNPPNPRCYVGGKYVPAPPLCPN